MVLNSYRVVTKWSVVCATSLLLFAQPVMALDLEVRIDGCKPGGVVYASLFGGAQQSFPQGPGLAGQYFPVTGGSVRIVFRDLPPGKYAISTFEDMNRNGKLDSNLLGVPVEPYAFSGTAGSKGPPTFDDAALDLTADQSVEIHLH